MYYLLGICLILACLYCSNFVFSAGLSIFSNLIANKLQNISARQRTSTIFAFRVFPTLFSMVFVFAAILPAFLLFEPYSTNEKLSWKLLIPAAFGLTGIFFAAYRIFETRRKTHRLVENFLKDSTPIIIEGVEFPVYRIKHQFPVIAVVGAFRPKMFIAEQIFSSLSKKELAAAVAHECGHIETQDNLKRLILKICRDLLVIPFGQKLDKCWNESIEAAADEYAAQECGNPSALDLAAALVKIARIVPKNSLLAMPQGAFLIENQDTDITWRVHHLIKLSETQNYDKQSLKINSAYIYGLVFLLTFFIILVLESNFDFFHTIHIFQENIVRFLQ